MELDLLLFVGFGLCLTLIFLVMYFKDVESTRKFERFERAIEDLNHQNHQLRQAIGGKDDDLTQKTDEKIASLETSVRNLENILLNLEPTKTDKDIQKIHIKSPSLFASNSQKILQLFKDGKSIQSIQNELQISENEILPILKMHNLA